MATLKTLSAEDRALVRERLAKSLRRWALFGMLFVGAYLLYGYGGRWVPGDMDTVPAIPAGSFCIIDRWQSTVMAGSHVFVALPDGRTVLTRVAHREGERITIEHPNPRSSFPDSRTLGPLPVSAVQGTVLGAFPGGDRDR
jgi:hypothetical protein